MLGAGRGRGSGQRGCVAAPAATCSTSLSGNRHRPGRPVVDQGDVPIRSRGRPRCLCWCLSVASLLPGSPPPGDPWSWMPPAPAMWWVPGVRRGPQAQSCSWPHPPGRGPRPWGSLDTVTVSLAAWTPLGFPTLRFQACRRIYKILGELDSVLESPSSSPGGSTLRFVCFNFLVFFGCTES